MVRRGKKAWRLSVLAMTATFVCTAAPTGAAIEGIPVLVVYGWAYNERDLALWPAQTDLVVENLANGLSTTAYISATSAGVFTGVLADFSGGWAASAGDTLRFSIPDSVGEISNPFRVVGQPEIDLGMLSSTILISAATTSAPSPLAPSKLFVAAFPNPVTTEAMRFVFRVPAEPAREASSDKVALMIVDAGGRECARFHPQLATRSEGVLDWDLRGPRGERVPAGVYFAMIRAAEDTRAVKFVVLE